MVFNVKLTGKQFKGCLSSDAGVYSLFRSVTITSGDGETVLEELNYYALAQAIKYHFENNESGNNLQYLHEGRPNKNHLNPGDTSYNQYCDCTDASGNHYNTVECTVPLWLSGILSPNRTLVWPNAYTRGLRIRLELYDSETVFEAAQAPMFGVDGVANGEYGGYSAVASYLCQTAAASGSRNIVLKKEGDSIERAGVLSADIAPDKDGVGCAHLFSADQWININSVEYQIHSVEINGDNRISITLTSDLTADVAVDGAVWVSTSTSRNDISVDIDNVRMNVSVAEPPKAFVDTMNSRLKSGKMNLDINSYTCYPFNLSKGSLSNTIPLNARNKRCKALIVVPMSGGSKSSIPTNKSFTPTLETPRSYQLALHGGVLAPDRLVNLERYNNERYDAVHLRELMLGLQAAGYKVRDIRDVHKFMTIARRFALPGYSFDAQGQISMNLNYKDLSEPVVLMNYLHHKRQIQVRSEGISVVT